MMLWSIQDPETLRRLERTERLQGDWRRVPGYWRPAFRWMTGQMCQKLRIPLQRPPVWAWHSYHGKKSRKPDLRCAGHLPAGTQGVRIEFRAPEELVLLSDFNKWHCVLNGWHCSSTGAEDKRLEALEKRAKLTGEMIEDSWQKIFDLCGGSSRLWGPADARPIQAALPWIELDWVRRVDRFTAR